MTTDIVPTVNAGVGEAHIPMCIKYSSVLSGKDRKSRRTIEKLLIEQLYWARHGWPLRLCHEQGFPMNRVRNLDMFRGSMTAVEYDRLNNRLLGFADYFKRIWTPDSRLNELLFAAASQFKLSTAEAAALLGRSVWMRILPLDLDSHQIHYEFPVRLIGVDHASRGCPDHMGLLDGSDLAVRQKSEAPLCAPSRSNVCDLRMLRQGASLDVWSE
jgi:hypothetical protein